MREELYVNPEVYSNESNSPIPSFFDHLTQSSNIHISRSAAPGSSMEQPVQCPIDIVSDDSFNQERIDFDISDDGMESIPIGNLGQSEDNELVGPTPKIPMVIVGSESNSEDSLNQNLWFLSLTGNHHLLIFQQLSQCVTQTLKKMRLKTFISDQGRLSQL